MIWTWKSLNVAQSQPLHQTVADLTFKLHIVTGHHNFFDIINSSGVCMAT